MDELFVPVGDLLLDPYNPRLPEELQGGEQRDILRFLFENAVLDELARSYVNNGFFRHEPLMVAPTDGGYRALEGNRRLAALKVLLQDEDAQETGLAFALDEEPSGDILESLLNIPAYVVQDRDAVRKYLGFRHIGGIKTWSAEAKARYLAAEVDESADDEAPFLAVARRVGSNVQGVRNAYIAISTLRYARDEFGLDVTSVQHNRFGVWTRCMNSPELRGYIGLGDPRSYEDVRADVQSLNKERLQEVLADLTPSAGKKRPLLADSRDVTVYAQALHHEQAHRALREYGDFELARQLVEEATLPDRLGALANSVESMISEVSRAEALPEGVPKLVQDLEQLVGALRAIVDSKG